LKQVSRLSDGIDPAERFSDRVEDYARYRPGYPRELIETLSTDCGLNEGAAIADMGCGTGNLAVIFLENGNTVFGVEPNAAMRAACRKTMQRFHRFHQIGGRAEATGLRTASVDFVVAGQAFHWFEPAATRAEFRRILKAGGWVALVWNERGGGPSAFLDAYEAILLRHGTDYRKIRESRGDEASIMAFFQGGGIRRAAFTHAQRFDFDGLKGRLLSSSYAPLAGHPAHEPMIGELREAFERYQKDGCVQFQYETSLWYRRLG
jgi:SAM-dependent methyltransferase